MSIANQYQIAKKHHSQLYRCIKKALTERCLMGKSLPQKIKNHEKEKKHLRRVNMHRLLRWTFSWDSMVKFFRWKWWCDSEKASVLEQEEVGWIIYRKFKTIPLRHLQTTFTQRSNKNQIIRLGCWNNISYKLHRWFEWRV